MVTFNDMQNIQGYNNSSKKMEEEALLQRLIDKKLEQKNQDKNLQEALQSQKSADAQKFEGIRTKHEVQFKALEQISKQLNVKVQDLNTNLIKQAVDSIDKSLQEVVQNIIKQENLAQLKQEYQNYQLKNKGVEQQFTKEMQLMESIAKALRIPVDQLTAGDVQKFLQVIKKISTEGTTNQEKIDQLAKELGIPKEQISTKDIQKLLDLFKKEQFAPKQQLQKDGQVKQAETHADTKLNKLEARQEDIQKILDKLKSKQEETLNKLTAKDQESQKVLEKQIGILSGKLQQLEQSLQQLSSQIKNTLNKDNKAELEERKAGLEGQVKELKGSLKELQGQKALQQAETEQLKGKYEKAQTSQEEIQQVKTRINELNNVEKELNSKLEKTTDETKINLIKEKIEGIKHEKEALLKSTEISKIQNKEVSEKETQQTIKQKLQPESFVTKDSSIKDVISKLENMENELKFKEIFEKEIKDQSSKEVKEKTLEIKNILKELITFKDGLKELTKLSFAEREEVFKNLLSEIKNESLKGKLENIVRQNVKSAEIIKQIISGTKTEITDAEAVIISDVDLDEFGEEDISKIFKVIGDKIDQLKISVRAIDALKGTLKNEAKEIQEKRADVVNILRAVIHSKSNGALGVNELLALFNADSLGLETVEKLMAQFENLLTTESQVQFILLLRGLFGKDINALKMLLSLLVSEGKVEESFIEEELGVIFTKEGSFEGESVSKEALDVLRKLTKISPEMLANNEALQQMVSKGRIDKEIFEKLFKKKVSEDAWDYGVMVFSKNKVGILKQRTEINSLADFWKLMERFSQGGDENTQETAELFLTSQSFSSYQRDLVSFFITQYQELFIDPDFHLFDLYRKYMDGHTFTQLTDNNREELSIAVLLRMVKSFEGPDKHQQFSKLIEMTKQNEYSPDFIRSVDILEYYFSQGGIIKRDFLNLKKELKLFNNVTEWRDELRTELEESTISKMVTGISKPIKKLESVKLGKLSDRFKKKQ